jgi:hypothetical protein
MALGNVRDFDSTSTIGTAVVPMWSPCFEANGTTEMFINDRVALSWTGGGRNMVTEFGRDIVKYAWLRPGWGTPPYSTRLGLSWRTCPQSL